MTNRQHDPTFSEDRISRKASAGNSRRRGKGICRAWRLSACTCCWSGHAQRLCRHARERLGRDAAKYGILSVCTLLVVGVFGMFRLLRWGWALVTSGCLVMAAGYFYGFGTAPYSAVHRKRTCSRWSSFLYLSRTEVRERLRSLSRRYNGSRRWHRCSRPKRLFRLT
jgi:hypothetical protein